MCVSLSLSLSLFLSELSESPPYIHKVALPFHAVIAAENLAAARTAADALPDPAPLPPRLAAYVRAYTAWVDGNVEAAAQRFEDALLAAPADVFALKRAQLLYFFAGLPRDMRRVTEIDAVAKALTGTPYYHGLTSFALEQTGDLDAALVEGRKAVELQPSDIWAVHGVAHALYFKAEVGLCVAWLRQTAPSWTGCAFITSHLWWHLAITLLDANDFPAVLDVYDKHLFETQPTADMQVQMGALGLLLKLAVRMAVHTWATPAAAPAASNFVALPDAVAARLPPVLAAARAKTTSHGDPFFDVLMAWAFAAGGAADASETLATSAAAAIDALPDARKRAVGTPWAAGMAAVRAFATGDVVDAVSQFKAFAVPVDGHPGAMKLASAPLGNSSEQRDVLDEVFALCMAVSGDAGLAAAAAAGSTARQAARGGVPADALMDVLCAAAVGDDDSAKAAALKAREWEEALKHDIANKQKPK